MKPEQMNALRRIPSADVTRVNVTGVPSFPWKLLDGGGLNLEMIDGVVFSSNAATGLPVPQFVSLTPFALPDDATTEIWFEAAVSNTAWATFFELWTVDTIAMDSGASLPADTLDLTDFDTGAGNVFVLVGAVTTAGGKITNINQGLRSAYYLVFPLGLDAGPFECPPEEEPAP